MSDYVFIIMTAAFGASSWLLVVLCQWLQGGEK